MQIIGERRRADMLRGRPGVGSVRVPLDHAAPDGPGFELAYAEAGADQAGPTLVLLPGGPGLASVLPYRKVRKQLAAHGLHVVTPEHRGVGLSRHTPDGALLPGDAVTLEQAASDALAVRDAVGGERAILAGTSYGGYLALEVARQAHGRFDALVLDSTAATVHRPERDHQRACFWDGTEPGFAGTAERVRALAEAGTVTDDELAMAVPIVYELVGPEALDRLLARAERGHVTTIKRLCGLGAREVEGGRKPLIFDGDLTMPIAFGRMMPERPDGRPFDRSVAMAKVRDARPDIADDPFDATPWLAELTAPALVLHGARDMRMAPGAVEELVDGLPNARRITFPHAGHDLLRLRAAACAPILAGLARDGLDGAERAVSAIVRRRPRWEPAAARLAAVLP
ncbi:MAG: alpha/beta fold hydrolase [Solirubrobacteraceae bacterium]|nr:alpha/beta fold hydrolase [Solirubrobacteraceae bacterium]